MANFFDQFDASPGADDAKGISSAESNFFDQFDAPGEAYSPGPVRASATANPVRARDLLRSFLGQGVAFGFGDEAEAGVRSLVSGMDYRTELDAIRASLEQFQKEHPTEAVLTELSGAIAPALLTGGLSAPTSIAGAVGRGAATGAAYGGAYGFGTGEGESDRLSGALQGAGIGGFVGGVAPGVALGVTEAARPIGRMVRGAFNPELEASRRVAQSIGADAANPALDDASFVMGQRLGQPVTNIERGGETTRALARSAANASPQARDTLNRVIDPRLEGQSDRVSGFVRRLIGNTTKREDLVEAARKANRGAYASAYKSGGKGLWTPELERLSGSPDVLAAMKAAAVTGKSRAINEGFGAFNPGVKIENDIVTFTTGRKGTPTYPNLQYWDYVKREIDDAANAARRAGRNEEASRLGGQSKLLRTELDKLVPSYRGAREGAAGFFDAQDALEAGQNFISRGFKLADAKAAHAAMSPAEQKLFAEGFTESLLNRISQLGDRRNVVHAIFGSADARARIQLALGFKKARELEAFLRTEAAMDLVRPAVQGNSTTARQLVEMGLVGSGFNLMSGNYADPKGLLVAMLYGAGRRGQLHLDSRVVNKVAEKLVSSDPTVYLEGTKMVAHSPALMRRLRSIGGVLGSMSAVGAEQAEEMSR